MNILSWFMLKYFVCGYPHPSLCTPGERTAAPKRRRAAPAPKIDAGAAAPTTAAEAAIVAANNERNINLR